MPYGSIAQNVALMAPDDNWTALASDPTNTTGVQRTAGRQLVVGLLGKRQRLFLDILHKRQRAGQFHARRNDHDFSVVLRKRRLVCPLHKKGRTRTRARTRSDVVKDIDGNEYPRRGDRRPNVDGCKPQNTASERRHRNSYRQGTGGIVGYLYDSYCLRLHGQDREPSHLRSAL